METVRGPRDVQNTKTSFLHEGATAYKRRSVQCVCVCSSRDLLSVRVLCGKSPGFQCSFQGCNCAYEAISSRPTSVRMRFLIQIAVIFIVLQQAFAYSKYGRSCKDIGCLNSEVCVMAEDPCSYYNRDQCGKYPTCKPAGSASSTPTCEGYTCPPTQICHIDDGTPKCVPARSSSTHVRPNENTHTGSNYPAQNPSYPAQNPSYPAQNPSYPGQHNPSAPSYPGQSQGGLYPSLTTSRPAQSGGRYPSQGGGYAGSAPNSGYPGYSGYPNQGYPSQGYPSQGYPSQGYPNQGYPNQGYPQYPNQGQYPGYSQSGYNRQSGYGSQSANTRYGGSAQSGSNPIVDKITDQLKTIGTSLLKNALGLNKQ